MPFAWESFFGRFFSPKIPKDVDVSFDSNLRQFSPRVNSKAKYNSPILNKTERDPQKTLHSDDFDDFLNGYTITIPADMMLTQAGLDHVKRAIKQGDY